MHIITNLGVGGAERILVDLCKELHQRSVQQVVISFRDGALAQELRERGITVYILSGFVARYDPSLLLRLLAVIKEEQPTVIHSLLWASNVIAAFCSWLTSVPLHVAVHSPTHQNGHAAESKIRLLLDGLVYRQAASIIAVSQQIAEQLKQRHATLSAKIHVIYNGINLVEQDHYRQQHHLARIAFGIPDNAFVIGAVGRLIPLKNHRLLIEAVQLLRQHIPHIKVLIVGYGPLEIALKKYAQEEGVADAVHIIAMNPVYAVYPLFDLFVLPSTYEGCPVTLLEALGAGTPVIVSRQTGARELIKEGDNGLLIDIANSQELVAAIKLLFDDASLRERIAKNGRSYCESSLQLSSMVDHYLLIFRGTKQ